MKDTKDDISYEVIDSMIVLSGTAIGRKPEKEIMKVMSKLVKTYNLRVLRSFGFDIPVDSDASANEVRGYEYWLAIDENEVRKLPNETIFNFESYNIYIKKIPSYRFARIRIEDPFSDSYNRIADGWRRLVRWLKDHDFKESGIVKCDNAYCLEEIKSAGESIVLDILVPVARVHIKDH